MKDLPSKQYLISSIHHYFDTSYLRNKWIKDDVYRFLAFIFRETQINKLKNYLREISKPAAILLIRKEESEKLKTFENRLVKLKDSLEDLDKLAIFRINLEKERG